MTQLQELIRATSASWNHEDPMLAWAGECGDFAHVVYYAAREQGIDLRVESFDDGLPDTCEFVAPPGMSLQQLGEYGVLPHLNHVWVIHEGRHYDAASPEGVDTPCRLRHFRQVAVEILRERYREKLAVLCDRHTYWRESVKLLDEFLLARYGTTDMAAIRCL